MAISFHFQEVRDSLDQKRKHKSWIKQTIESNKKQVGEIAYIFCQDQYLLDLNKQHLNHNTLTDIITFDLSDDKHTLSADIYISMERVAENAKKFNKSRNEELRRVMIHGVLHLLGWKDKSKTDKQKMRKAEDSALAIFDRSKWSCFTWNHTNFFDHVSRET